jgi:beta-glucosidase
MDSEPHYTAENPLTPFRLPEDFLLGTATSSLQIEGGTCDTTWHRWAQESRIRDGTDPRRACDHWNRVDQDRNLIKDLETNAYRMSIEWSRIEPEKGRFETSALDHYRQELHGLIEIGVVPIVTLHHFSEPAWFQSVGGFARSEGVDAFLRFTETVCAELAGLIPVWITFNEPNVYLANGYIFGVWPPGEKSSRLCDKALGNMAEAHRSAVTIIQEARRSAGHAQPSIGVAHHLRVFEPDGTRFSRRIAGEITRRFQERFLDLFHEGSTFLGVNYYTRDMVRFSLNPRAGWSHLYVKPGRPANDLGWEIYSEGLYLLCRKYAEHTGLPVIITENGVCDAADQARIGYIYDHLYQAARLHSEGVDIRGYLHWSLLDNFEWLDGESARFGLYEVDYLFQDRRLRRSGEFFRELCISHGVTYEMIDRYLGRLKKSD